MLTPNKNKLSNPIIASNCYIGSNSNPIVLNNTTGTTEPPPQPNRSKASCRRKSTPTNWASSTRITRSTWNSFAAPGANGCELKLFGFIPISINGLIDEISGLPAAAGTNEAVQDFNLELTYREFVYP